MALATTCIKGEVFGNLQILGEANPAFTPDGASIRCVRVRCTICGAERSVRAAYLRDKKPFCHLCQKPGNLKHGLYNHPIYGVWAHMKDRVLNPRCREYPWYGARGISVCDEWLDCQTFIAWAENNGWAKGLELDRMNNDGNYDPSNCRFVAKLENLRNQGHHHRVTAFGETKLLVDWAADPRCQLSFGGLWSRINRGMNPETAIALPLRRRPRVKH